MEVGFHQFTTICQDTIPQDDNQISPKHSDESHPSPMFRDSKATSTSSPKRSRRGTKKRVVHVPIKEVEGPTNAPPSDSWAWRKYGQKPIKGSPYPRGYYRCSSSKGCPARKQVERSRTDPTMVMVTYSCEHNHPWPASRNNNHHHNNRNPPPSPPTNSNVTDDQLEEEEEEDYEEDPPIQNKQSDEPEPEPEPQLELETEQKFTSLAVGSCGSFPTTTDEYLWFSEIDSTSSTMLESPLMASSMVEDNDMATIFSIREDEESFFADLGELPECATVFRRREVAMAEDHHRSLAPWCGTTG